MKHGKGNEGPFRSSDEEEYAFHLVDEFRSGHLTRREVMQRASVAGIGAFGVGMILAACGSSSASSPTTTQASGPPRRGGTVNFGAVKPVGVPDPITVEDDGGLRAVQVACDYLCYPRPDYTLDPRLAVSWRAKNNGREWTFALRHGVTFHDGSPMTADDVVSTYQKLTNPKGESAALSAFQGVLSYGNTEKVDDYTVRFHLDRPYVGFPYLTSAFNYNSVILPKDYQMGTWVKRGGIGTGPFILKQFNIAQQATFVRNPNYWGKPLPYLDGVVLKYFNDTPGIVLAMEAGAIQAFPTMVYQGSQALYHNPNIVILKNHASDYRTLQMRVDKAPWNDKRVRQALALCLNRPALVQELFAGQADLGNDHAFAPVFPDSPPPGSIPQRAQDYAQAKALLSQAGHPNGVDVTMTTEQYLEVPEYAVAVKQQAAPANIRINLNIESQTAYYGSGNNQPWLSVPFGITDWAARGTAGQVIDPAYRCHGVWNSAHWCDPQFDSLVSQFEGTLDEATRRQIAIKAARIQRDEVPDIIAYWDYTLRAVDKDIHGLAPGPNHLDVRAVWRS